jgi:hypothetical protein
VAVEELIRTQLLRFSAVTALVEDRIYPDVVPQLTDAEAREMKAQAIYLRPTIVIDMLEETPQNTLDGGDGMVVASVSIRCIAQTKKVARQLAEAVRVNGTDPGTGLAGFNGLTDIDDEKEEVSAIHLRNMFDAMQWEDGGDEWVFEVAAIYEITYYQVT